MKSGHIHICLIDDDEIQNFINEKVIQKHIPDSTVTKYLNAKQAIDDLRSSALAPDVILLDINMPILDGKETLSILKRTDGFSEIPVVVFTTSNSELDKLFCKRMNVEMITKPPHYKSLESAVLRLLQFCGRG